MNGGGKKAIVDAETAEGNAIGVTGTPAFLINGRIAWRRVSVREF